MLASFLQRRKSISASTAAKENGPKEASKELKKQPSGESAAFFLKRSRSFKTLSVSGSTRSSVLGSTSPEPPLTSSNARGNGRSSTITASNTAVSPTTASLSTAPIDYVPVEQQRDVAVVSVEEPVVPSVEAVDHSQLATATAIPENVEVAPEVVVAASEHPETIDVAEPIVVAQDDEVVVVEEEVVVEEAGHDQQSLPQEPATLIPASPTTPTPEITAESAATTPEVVETVIEPVVVLSTPETPAPVSQAEVFSSLQTMGFTFSETRTPITVKGNFTPLPEREGSEPPRPSFASSAFMTPEPPRPRASISVEPNPYSLDNQYGPGKPMSSHQVRMAELLWADTLMSRMCQGFEEKDLGKCLSPFHDYCMLVVSTSAVPRLGKEKKRVIYYGWKEVQNWVTECFEKDVKVRVESKLTGLTFRSDPGALEFETAEGVFSGSLKGSMEDYLVKTISMILTEFDEN
ncbi:UNVERIFIED_CONTAM: hypothetical protein HDU68_011547 [Siphonaria sp. JEL0065]|nr:hypothetical protein HDU68_011547 [Siphonaria sp. JEL0065]